MASTNASSVSKLIEYPIASKNIKLPTKATGTVTAGISVARMLPKNKNITKTTKPIEMASVLYTSLIDSLMNTDES